MLDEVSSGVLQAGTEQYWQDSKVTACTNLKNGMGDCKARAALLHF